MILHPGRRDLTPLKVSQPPNNQPQPTPNLQAAQLEADVPVKRVTEQAKGDELNQNLTSDMRAQKETDTALSRERNRVKEILLRRPDRTERGFWREAWSFMIIDKDDRKQVRLDDAAANREAEDAA